MGDSETSVVLFCGNLILLFNDLFLIRLLYCFVFVFLTLSSQRCLTAFLIFGKPCFSSAYFSNFNSASITEKKEGKNNVILRLLFDI